jgi:hypothetical protein
MAEGKPAACGTEIELLISRRGRIVKLSLALDEARPETYEIRPKAEFSQRLIRRLESWLGQSLDLKAE